MIAADWLTTFYDRHHSALVDRPIEIVVVIVAAFFAAVFGRRLIKRGLGRVARHATREHVQLRAKTIVSLIANLWRFFVVAVAVTTILGLIGLDLTPLLASATIIGATLGFGAQIFVRDYLSGVLIALEDQYSIGDTITVGLVTGVVEEMDLRITRLRAADGVVWFVPNGEIRNVSNRSRGWAMAVADVPVARADPDATAAALRAAIAQVGDGDAELRGIVATDTDTDTWRAVKRTTPARRDATARHLRAAMVGALTRVGLPPTSPQPAPADPSTA